MTTTIRVSSRTHETVQRLAQADGVAMQEILEWAVEAYRRQHILHETNAAYAAIRANQADWQQLEGERQEWDATLGDGLPAD